MSGERTDGRGGVGTVMGSKNLKAITINAKRNIEVHDPVAFAREVKAGARLYQTDMEGVGPKVFGEYGTGSTEMHNVAGFFPVRNFR